MYHMTIISLYEVQWINHHVHPFLLTALGKNLSVSLLHPELPEGKSLPIQVPREPAITEG